MHAEDRPLRIALLAYRGKPHVGGQGVYVRHLSKALADLGHHVEVLGGQPYPVLDERVPLVELPSLDIYNDHFPMRMPGIWELKHWTDLVEVTSFSFGQFPEPLAFSLRAWRHLRRRSGEFDLVHDNQSLGYGLLGIQQAGLPVMATIHHPITVDRRLEMEHAEGWYKRLTLRRWYSFTNMQTRVVKRLQRVITVSENSFRRHRRDHEVDPDTHGDRAGGRRRRPVPAPAGRRAGARPAHHHRQRRRDDEGPALPARGPGQGPHRARRTPTWSSSASARPTGGPTGQSASWGWRTPSSSSPACPTSASSSSTPRPSWPSCPRSTRASRCPPSRPCPAARRWSPPPAGRCPRSSAPTARPRWSCRRATARRWPPSCAGRSTATTCGRPWAPGPPAGHRPVVVAAHRREDRRAVPHPARPGRGGPC